MKRILFALSLLFLLTLLSPLSGNLQAQSDGWVWLNPLPQGNHLRALWGSGPNDVYAVGEVGAIIHYDGSTWQPFSNLPGEDTLLGVWGAGPNDIFAAGVNALWHYDGASWKAMDPPAGVSEFLARGVWGTSGNNVYVASYTPEFAAIFHYDGTTWHDMDVPIRFYTYMYDIWGSGPDNIFAVGDRGTIFHYNGHSWQEMDSSTQATLYTVWGSGPNDVYAGGYSFEDFDGIVLHYDGVSWKKVFSLDVQIVSIWGFAADDIYAMDKNGNVYHFDGQSWNQVWDFISQRTSHLYDLWGSDPDHMFAVGWDGVVTHYDGSQWRDQIEGPDFQGDGGIWTDGQRVVSVGTGPKALVYDGAQWTLYTLPREIPDSMWMSGHANDLWGPSWDDIYAVGDGLIWHFDGQTWTRVHQMLSEDGEDIVSFWGVWGFSPTDIYAVGYLYDPSPGNIYIILHYDGSQWSVAYQGRGEGKLVDIWGSSPNDLFVAAEEGGMLHYNGYSWRQMSTTYFDSVWGTGPHDVWATGRSSSGGAAIYHYDGTRWRQSYENIRFALDRVWGTGPNDIYAIGSQDYSSDATLSRAVVLHYDGSQWREIDAPFSRHMRQINGTKDMLLMTGYGDNFLGMGQVPPPVRTWVTPGTPMPTPTHTPTPTPTYTPTSTPTHTPTPTPTHTPTPTPTSTPTPLPLYLPLMMRA